MLQVCQQHAFCHASLRAATSAWWLPIQAHVLCCPTVTDPQQGAKTNPLAPCSVPLEKQPRVLYSDFSPTLLPAQHHHLCHFEAYQKPMQGRVFLWLQKAIHFEGHRQNRACLRLVRREQPKTSSLKSQQRKHCERQFDRG